jgi:ABC-type lipoprotein export system ATPase subunit
MITAHDLYRTYGRGDDAVRALDGVSLEVSEGEFVGLRGHSGSGKTTLLMALGGLLRPASGRVTVAGEDLYGLSTRARTRFRAQHIGMVFQLFHLVPYLDVFDNIMLGGASADRERAEQLLETLELTDRRRHRPHELSAGQMQRLALARALLKRPEALLADEPTGNLDDDSARIVLACLDEHRRDGGAVILATHDARLLGAVDRTLVLASGRLTTPETAPSA